MKMFLRKISRALRTPINRRSALKQLALFHSEPRGLDEVVQWAMKFPSRGNFRVESIQIKSEITSLAQRVAAIKPERILEIGTARGGTLFLWSQLASRKVISCDILDPGVRRDLYSAFPPPGSSCEVVNLTGDSHTSEFKQQVEKELSGELVDFLFIDGDHTEVGVEADYNDYHHLVRPGGLIAFHDIVIKQPFPTNQVYGFWVKLKEQLDTEDLVEDPDQVGFGIGLVKVPS